MRIVRLFLVVAAIAATQPACATFATNLPKVTAAVQDGTMILDSIESFAHSVFLVNPSPDLESKVTAAIARTRAALAFALRSSAGAADLTQDKVDTAFGEFRLAYADLLAMVAPLGVTAIAAPAVAATVKAAAATGGLAVPHPIDFGPRL